jgi:mono/diheme cytochrome c family protein
MDKIIVKISYLAMLISGLSIILVIGALFLKSKQEKVNVAWCGATDPPSELYNNNKGAGMKGEYLFKKNCSSCHSPYQLVVGPALSGISRRRPQKWIREMIRHGESLKDPYTIALKEKYYNVVHPNYESLSRMQIDQIIAYLDSSGVIK